jgi:hypothetical protein
MLSSVSLKVPANRFGMVVCTAMTFGIQVENNGADAASFHYLDLEGNSQKIDRILSLVNNVEVLDRINSVPGDHEGFGLVNDIEDQRRNNYGALMQPTIK